MINDIENLNNKLESLTKFKKMTDIIEKRKIYSPAEQETFSFSDEIKRSLVSKSKFVKKIEEIEKWLQNSNKNIKENDEKLKKLEKKYEKLTKYSGKTSEPNGKKNSSIKEVYSKLLKHLNKMISINQKSKNSQTMTLKIKDSETELKFLKEEEKRLNLEISSNKIKVILFLLKLWNSFLELRQSSQDLIKKKLWKYHDLFILNINL